MRASVSPGLEVIRQGDILGHGLGTAFQRLPARRVGSMASCPAAGRPACCESRRLSEAWSLGRSWSGRCYPRSGARAGTALSVCPTLPALAPRRGAGAQRGLELREELELALLPRVWGEGGDYPECASDVACPSTGEGGRSGGGDRGGERDPGRWVGGRAGGAGSGRLLQHRGQRPAQWLAGSPLRTTRRDFGAPSPPGNVDLRGARLEPLDLVAAMLLETGLERDRERPGTAAVCTLGGTRGKSPGVPAASSPGWTPRTETARATEMRGTGCAGLEARPRKSHRSAGGTQRWEHSAGREFPDPRVARRAWRWPARAGQWWSRDPRKKAASQAQLGGDGAELGPHPGLWILQQGTQGWVSRLNHSPQGPFHHHGRWEIMESLLEGRPDASSVGRLLDLLPPLSPVQPHTAPARFLSS
ncbi:hypothetical protein P7K49_002024 [Saguinus oedipus]|uniref:Uncharacterized protein n=1 Tax=Saguinus oedipus TaxID=9490 RepID=A0ABQ9WIS7_SAGOE|nr:hypothetical protein P7K49_002024 [Saguinus oedipus]